MHYVASIFLLPKTSYGYGRSATQDRTFTRRLMCSRRAWDREEVTLGPHEYFVIGDNRGMSASDHDFGRVQADKILGKLIF